MRKSRSSSRSPPPSGVIEGSLFKSSSPGASPKNFVKRYFVLDPAAQTLSQWDSEVECRSGGPPRSTIDVAGAELVQGSHPKFGSAYMELRKGDLVLPLAGTSAEAMGQWRNAISAVSSSPERGEGRSPPRLSGGGGGGGGARRGPRVGGGGPPRRVAAG